MHHRLYKLTHGLSLMGLRPQDLIILFVAFMLGLQVLGALFPGRLRILFAVAFIAVSFKLWQGLRDRLPDKFLLHLLGWLSEPDAYRVRPDTDAIPLVVDPLRVRRLQLVPPTAQGRQAGEAPSRDGDPSHSAGRSDQASPSEAPRRSRP